MSTDQSTDRWANIATFPSVNGKALAFILLVTATFLNDSLMTWAAMVWQMRHPETALKVPDMVDYLHSGWLMFLAAFGGISLGQFIAKRTTYAAPSPDSERADVPSDPPPTQPSPAPMQVPAGPPTPVPAPIPPAADDRIE